MLDTNKCSESFALRLTSLQTQATPRLLMNVMAEVNKKPVRLLDLCEEFSVESPSQLNLHVRPKNDVKLIEKTIGP